MTLKLHTRIVAADDAGIRLDRWFRRHFSGLSHGQLQKLLRTGQIRVDGKRAEASTRLAPGQNIRVPPSVTAAPPKAAIETRSRREADRLRHLILYEDDDVIVLNKPAGLAVQGGSGLKENIDDMLQSLAPKGREKPKLAHRLDRDTSGVLLVARTTSAARKLAEAFRERATRKIYWGLTVGVPKPEQGRIEAPLIRKGELMAVDADDEEAKTAVTLYQTVESAKKLAAFVALWPVTGRTHQLRVHMAHIGAPLLGDKLYGKAALPGVPENEIGKALHLHARRLIIPHPRRGAIDVVAPLGPEMRKTWTWFGFDEKAEADFTGM